MSNFSKISNYYKSFSGTDTLAFILMPGCAPVVIGSLTTISYSMFRNKKPVINIGRTNINGVTRGSRIYAGTMVFTLINQHWLRELQEQIAYISNFSELKVDELPLFDIMIVSANEYGNAVTMYIYGIDFTDEAQTISVEDLFTENVFSFVARDISTFKAFNVHKQETEKSHSGNELNEFTQRLHVLGSSTITIDDIAAREHEIYLSKLVDMQKPQTYYLLRDLYLNNSNFITGNDVLNVQVMLREFFPDIPLNGVFDETMKEYVKKYESLIGDENIDGVVDSKLYNSLISNTLSPNGNRTGIIINKNGAFGYNDMSLNSNVHSSLVYKEQVEIMAVITSELDGYKQQWYKTDKGYIPVEDVYSAIDEHNVVEYPTIRYNDDSMYVKIIQSALNELFPGKNLNSGIMDDITIDLIKQIQRENGLVDNGEVNNETWLLLQTLLGNVKQEVSQENLKLNCKKMPNKYNISIPNLFNDLSNFDIEIETNVSSTVKTTAVIYYPDGSSEIMSKTKVVNQDDNIISLFDLEPAFLYNSSHGNYPERVEWIVYPCNQTPYKWTLYCNK